ncbi:MAG TPA: hypothetical protein VF808_16480 [Ktedonobacterales bacterium]
MPSIQTRADAGLTRHATAPRERRLRQTAAWGLLALQGIAQLGAIWDREWHHYIGRDSFFIPPHILIYSGVLGAGIIALAVVLTDTRRYHRGAPGVDDTSTTRVFGWFHAPLGYIIAGFGILDMLASAPLDNYWHELYGIDVVLWAPFHLMGIAGGLIGMLGMMYIFASEETICRERGEPRQRFLQLTALEWGMVAVVATFLAYVFTGFLQLPILSEGLLNLPTATFAVAMAGAFAFPALARFTHVPGVATLTLAPLLAYSILEQFFLPWGVTTFSAALGMSFRVADRPAFSLTDAALPLIYLLPALIVDGWTRWRLRRGVALNGRLWNDAPLGALIAHLPGAAASCLLLGSWNVVAVLFEQPGVTIPPELKAQAALIGIPITLLFGAAGAVGAALFGDIWRWSQR